MIDNTETFQFHSLAPKVAITEQIQRKWKDLGGVDGILGYPIWPAVKIRSGGETQRFQHGQISYHPNVGTYYVSGKILLCWQDQLGVYGHWGFPTSDPYEVDGVTFQHFQHFTIHSDQPEITNGIDLRGEIARREITIRNQGLRGTCSVHVMVFLLEYQYVGFLGRDYSHLSVEYANHFANVASGDRDDGHCFDRIEMAYERFGIIKDSIWPYDKDSAYDYDRVQETLSPNICEKDNLVLNGGVKLQGRFLKKLDGTVGLSDDQFGCLLDCLDSGVPVGVGRDHSMVAVGYRRCETFPDKGYIIFRNSHGFSSDYSGYQTEPFDKVRQTVNDLYVYTHNTHT